MNLLLDTHVLLWWLDDPTLLSGRTYAKITGYLSEFLFSELIF